MLIATTACSIAIFEHRERTLDNQYVNGVAGPAGPKPWRARLLVSTKISLNRWTTNYTNNNFKLSPKCVSALACVLLTAASCGPQLDSNGFCRLTKS